MTDKTQTLAPERWREKLEFCRRWGRLTPWERNFLDRLSGLNAKPSKAQVAIIIKLAETLPLRGRYRR